METKREIIDEERLHTPAFLEISETNAHGKPGRRIVYILKTTGCAKAISGDVYTILRAFGEKASENITEKDLITQADELFALPEIHEIIELDISAIGLSFDDKELSEKIMEYILKRAAEIPNIIKVSVGTNTRNIKKNKLEKTRNLLRKDQEFEIAVNYETQDDNIREGIFNSKTLRHNLDRCINICHDTGVAFKGIVLIKPPPLNEEEAIEEAVEAAMYIFKKCKRYQVQGKVSFRPLFITGQILNSLFKDKKFTPPNLWTVVEVIQRTVMAKEQENLPGTIHCAFNDENIGEKSPDSCPECKDKIISAIRRFNASQCLEEFEGLDCSCRGIDRISKTITADVSDVIKGKDAPQSHKPLTDEEYQLLLFGYINLENVFWHARSRGDIPIYAYYSIIEKTISDLMSLREKMTVKFMTELKRLAAARSRGDFNYSDYKSLIRLMRNEIDRQKKMIMDI